MAELIYANLYICIVILKRKFEQNLQNQHFHKAQEAWPKGKLFVPFKRQPGGRGAHGTRSLALGPKLLCHPKGSWEGKGQMMAQEVWP